MLSSYKYSFDNNEEGRLSDIKNMGLLNEFWQMIVFVCVQASGMEGVWFLLLLKQGIRKSGLNPIISLKVNFLNSKISLLTLVFECQ